MSRTPESNQNLESKKRLFAEAGILLDLESDGELSVDIQGSGGNFPLTEWFKQKTHYHAEVGLKNAFFNDFWHHEHGNGNRVTVRIENASPAEFILNLLHEMGHGFGERLHGYMHSGERDIIPDFIDDPEERLEAKIRGLAQHEQEAWEIALRILIMLHQTTGWDIRTLVSSPEELVTMMERGYFMYRDVILDYLRRKGKDRFEPIVRASFDTHYLKFIAKQFWEKF